MSTDKTEDSELDEEEEIYDDEEEAEEDEYEIDVDEELKNKVPEEKQPSREKVERAHRLGFDTGIDPSTIVDQEKTIK